MSDYDVEMAELLDKMYAQDLAQCCWLARHGSLQGFPGLATAAVDENAPVERAKETIKDLKDGKLPHSVVRDLGDAVSQATRDIGVGRAIGR